MKPQPRCDDPIAQPGFETLCTHFGEDSEAQQGAVTPPIYQSSTFAYPDAEAFVNRRPPAGLPTRHDYTRISNPTTSILESKLARLENAAWAQTFGSGMGAISAAINACISADQHIVCVEHVYGPTRWYLQHLRRFNIETTFVAGTGLEAFAEAIRDNTALLYLESPTSGHFDMPDVVPIAAAAHHRQIPVLFDNSWATPYFQTPLDLGCDLILHSATKYLNGHSDVVAGVVLGRDDALREKVWREAELCGAALDPFAAWLMLRGLRTLPIRMEAHQEKALAVARALEAHPKVRRVHHPGLESHPDREIATRQLRGCSGLFSFELEQQSRAATHKFLDALCLFSTAVSWGGYESLAVGGDFFSSDPLNPVWLIRLSIGLESTNDLINDVHQALEQI